MNWFIPVLVAVITGPVVVLLQLLRRENTNQHAEGRELLHEVIQKVDNVGTKIDNHIGWHEGIKKQ
jgi:hypothetical protein